MGRVKAAFQGGHSENHAARGASDRLTIFVYPNTVWPLIMNNPDDMFRAFADRTRLRLLNLLRDGEVCVGDLVVIIGAPQPTISRHLAYLRGTGLVEVEREGNWCFYRLAEPSGPFHDRLLECLSCCLAETPQLRQDARELERLKKSGACCMRRDSIALRGGQCAINSRIDST